MLHININNVIRGITCAGMLAVGSHALAAYDVEKLDRGVVAVAQNGSVFLSWRWLGDEIDNTGYNIYRDGVRINSSPITNKTNYVDYSGNVWNRYTITAVVNGMEQQPSPATTPWNDIALRIPLQRPSGGTTPDGRYYTYTPNDASVADLDGDGQYEIILKWDPSNSKDNSQKGYTGNVYIDAYELDGTRLWRIDLGRNIRAGAHYTQFIAYDLDSDGKAEVAMRTSDGSVDGTGAVIGNRYADYRNSNGYVLSGPEYLTIFDGSTGRMLAKTNYVPARGNVSSWGDSYGNRVDRFLAGLAWLDGEKPSLIMARGYYTRAVVAAWDWRNGQLRQRWVADSNQGMGGLAGQGAHSLSVADVDNDGRQEIIYGAATLDDNGSLMYSTRLGHGDALHVSDLRPDYPGLEVYMVHETPSMYGNHGSEMHNAATGEIIWGVSGERADVGRGVAMDIDPRYPGYEAWASRGGLRSSSGNLITNSRPSAMNFGVYWDGDLGRELLDGTTISKWNYYNSSMSTLLAAGNWSVSSNNSTKATPVLSADILGDWREEVIWRANSGDALLLFTSTHESPYRLRTLMHDPQYRAAVAWQNVGYNQPPHPGFFLGYDMVQPPMLALNPVSVQAPSVELFSSVYNGAVSLSWNIHNANIRGLEVYRDTDSNPSGRTRIGIVSASTRNFTDTTAERGRTYYYWIKMTEQDGTVTNSNGARVVVPRF
ncbi:rhamnogalacturonan lyase [Gynuella sp.]|uniref:rhamnogalacturonan lyase n=1 Tax=Gynuella sp. TaxID=2969146 RepID=UPI003D0F448F